MSRGDTIATVVPSSAQCSIYHLQMPFLSRAPCISTRPGWLLLSANLLGICSTCHGTARICKGQFNGDDTLVALQSVLSWGMGPGSTGSKKAWRWVAIKLLMLGTGTMEEQAFGASRLP